MSLDPAFLARPIAHRGLHGPGVPENSLTAAQAAIAAGYGIELDLQLSSDGRAMVFHDDDLPRLTGETGWVAQRDAAALGALRLLGTGERVPTFSAFLDLVAGRVPLLIELKDQLAHPGGALGPLEAAVARDLAGYEGPAAVMSFHPQMMVNMARLAPELARGLTGEDFSVEPGLDPETVAALNDYALFDAAGCAFVSHDWQALEMPSVRRLRARGVPVLCWTIRSQQEADRALAHCDNVTFEGYLPA